ncbi:MAG: M23 family metallopeptidase [Candidatus Acidoferrales bacterium]
MQKQRYTFYFVHDARGRIRKLTVPSYLVTGALVLVLILGGGLLTGIASYLHLRLRVSGYDQVRAEREQLRRQNRALQASYQESQQRLTTLESLANEVAATYGLLRLRHTPFGTVENTAIALAPEDLFTDTLARYRYLRRHATAVTLYASGVRPLLGRDLTDVNYTPSLWPVRGRLISGFGARLDPFNGEGSFHSGVDISTSYGEDVHAAADGFVVAVGRRTNYGRVVVVDHGGGVTTLYAHLSGYRAYPGRAVSRGDIIGYVGSSGRSKGPHLHYEVRLRNAPVNPWPFLRTGRVLAARAQPFLRGGSD